MNISENLNVLSTTHLFGSFAYGNPNEDSDYDIYFIVDKINGSKYATLVEIYGVINGIKNKPVDVLLNTKEYFDYRKDHKATLEHKIVKNGIKLYG